MRKVAIFTEGQTELIFVREFLFRLIDPSKLSIECWELLAHNLSYVPFPYSSPSPEVHFFIVDAHGDKGVLSAIREREKDLIQKGGYEKIIGLRDMYSEEYKKLSPGAINDSITRKLIQSYNLTIQDMTYSTKIKLYLAIMEIEAWFLAMYNIFERIDTKLTVGKIKQNLDIDLMTVDPQRAFFKPAEQIDDIFQLCERRYDKKKGDAENICSKMVPADFDNATENNRCECFDAFYQEIRGYSS